MVAALLSAPARTQTQAQPQSRAQILRARINLLLNEIKGALDLGMPAQIAWTEGMARLALDLRRQNFSQSEVQEFFGSISAGDTWITRLRQYQVLAQLPTATPTTTPVTTTTRLAPPTQPQTETHVQKSVAPQGTLGAKIPARLSTKNPLSSFSNLRQSFIWAGSSGSGKTTGLHCLCWMLHTSDPTTQFVILDLQAHPWLGLTRCGEGETVIQLPSPNEENLVLAAKYIAWVADQLNERIEHAQAMARSGTETAVGHPIWLVVNEWNRLYRAWNNLSQARKVELGIKDFLDHVLNIVHSGRERNVGVILSCHSHNVSAIGLGPDDYASVTFLASGRIDPASHEGGYDSLAAVVKDNRILRDEAMRNELREAFEFARKNSEYGAPLLAWVGGDPMIAAYSVNPEKIRRQDISGQYRYRTWALPRPQFQYNQADLGEHPWRK